MLKEVKAAKTQRKKAKAKEDQEEDDFIGVADDNVCPLFLPRNQQNP